MLQYHVIWQSGESRALFLGLDSCPLFLEDLHAVLRSGETGRGAEIQLRRSGGCDFLEGFVTKLRAAKLRS